MILKDIQVNNYKLFVLEGEKVLKGPMDRKGWEQPAPSMECNGRIRPDSDNIIHCLKKGKIAAQTKKLQHWRKKWLFMR